MQGWPSFVKVEEFQGCRKGDACLAYTITCKTTQARFLKKPPGKSHKTGLHKLYKIQTLGLMARWPGGYGVTFGLSMMLITFRNSKE